MRHAWIAVLFVGALATGCGEAEESPTNTNTSLDTESQSGVSTDTAEEAETNSETSTTEETNAETESTEDTESVTETETESETTSDTESEVDLASLNLNGTIPPAKLAAPVFTALASDGSQRTQGDLLGSPTVVWFFPFAETPG